MFWESCFLFEGQTGAFLADSLEFREPPTPRAGMPWVRKLSLGCAKQNEGFPGNSSPYADEA